ncbi:glycosyltransferase [bacterium]|nr:glycosyltransferase [bacterium]MBU1984084.1 glycosyltransferase [bacterium]
MAVQPLSVKLPIYNAERFLAECIRSIQGQTFGDFEVIAVLDGCSDRSEEILMDLKDERFHVIKHETNLGVVTALNEAIALARAPLIARMDADDIMLPERLKKQVEFMTAYPEVAMLGTWFDTINESGSIVKKSFPFPTDHDEIKRAFRRYNVIGGPTMCMRVEPIRAIGGYAAEMPYADDLTLSLQCLAAGYRFANLPEVLLHYRISRGQLMERRREETFRMTNRAYAKYGPLIWGDDAPEYELGAPLHRRIMKKLRRLARGKR